MYLSGKLDSQIIYSYLAALISYEINNSDIVFLFILLQLVLDR